LTVGSQIKQTVASLKGAKETLSMYAAQTTKEQEKAALERNTEKLQKIIDLLQHRVGTIEWEEPQYKGF
jgi:hypothetical protein